MRIGLLDTSALIAIENGRADFSVFPDELAVSAITVGELMAGIHAAPDDETRSRRLLTFEFTSSLIPLEVDFAAASEWARMRHSLVTAARRVNVNDLWIASVALVNKLPVVTQDGDFDLLVDLGGPEVIRV